MAGSDAASAAEALEAAAPAAEGRPKKEKRGANSGSAALDARWRAARRSKPLPAILICRFCCCWWC